MGPPKEVRPNRVETQRTSSRDPWLGLGRTSSSAVSAGSFIMLGHLFERTLGDFQLMLSSLGIHASSNNSPNSSLTFSLAAARTLRPREVARYIRRELFPERSFLDRRYPFRSSP